MDSVKDLLDRTTKADNGFPFPDWGAIAQWREQRVAQSDLDNFDSRIADAWVERIQVALDRSAIIHRSPNFLFLLSEDEKTNRNIVDFSERAWARIRELLKGLAFEEADGPGVILLMPDSDSYCRYVAHFYPEGHSIPASCGIFLNEGYGHIALHPADLWSVQTTLLHELLHNAVFHLPLPPWLNEGIAQALQITCGLTGPLQLDPELAERHYSYWGEKGIRAFWSGESFGLEGDGQELSYQLAELLVRLILEEVTRDKAKFVDFARDAVWTDAGEASALQHLGRSLGDIAAIFLGPGDWVPRISSPPDSTAGPPCQNSLEMSPVWTH